MQRKRLVLLWGRPNSGKTYLSHRLRDEKGFQVICTDHVYVDWIRVRYPELYFTHLPKFISPHWRYIVRDGKKAGLIADNIESAWPEHLFDIYAQQLAAQPKVVVEGFLVRWAHERLRNLVDEST